jgi:hypothetical protein
MSIREAEACSPWLGDENGRAEGLPRFHLLHPSVGALARETDTAFQRKLGGVAARLASVLVRAGDEGLALGVGREVRAPAFLRSLESSGTREIVGRAR